ncbi:MULTISPECIES: manganese efflux pump MntP family protein [Pseudoalteromonas]|uniref:manganese efflux pump MntP n=1 Tax=Pseudoalteromonas TaxID=53246 RepID=UPI0015822942|nr:MULTISPECIES: manganese efflux pump MntP family protein [Pseudoalteromonas]MDI4652912.1 manganese efflux pump MntP family protein [Pseudoalteromonas shioyasakiensis]NUJ38900.1 manganese efflux pump [Pseudoalteromonas sp. 0303]
MNIITLSVLSLAMSTDAFAASITKGSTLKNPRVLSAIKLGLLFGCIEAIAPIVGWLIGSAGADYVEAFDHWIAFMLLVGLGIHMLLESRKDDDEEELAPNTKRSFIATVLTAVGTSIDAMTVGISLAFMKVNIYLAAAMIGLATTIMVTIGALLGNVMSGWVGKKAEAIGGVALIFIGCGILYSHTMA